MGSNQNRFGDKKFGREWSKKDRKHEDKVKRKTMKDHALSDQIDPGLTYYRNYAYKDVKKYCKGKDGRPHEWTILSENTFMGYTLIVNECVNCKRKKYGEKK